MSFPLERVAEVHGRMRHLAGVTETLLLSTCNRVEILAHAPGSGAAGLETLRRFLAEEHRLSLEEIDRYTYQLQGRDAIKHVFTVACGLDSMILGEPQILGQVKQAYLAAREQGTLGPMLDRLLQHGLATAKRVRTETGIARHAVSVAYAAVELGRRIFGDLAGREVLLLGAGKMGALVARHLASQGVRRLVLASRTYTHAVLHAERVGGEAVSWEEGLPAIGRSDIVISCTGAAHKVLTKADVSRAMRGRKQGPLFLIDIAVPRDIDPQVNELDDVYLYDIDGLQGVVDSNLDERREAAARAQQMIASEVTAFERWLRVQEVTPLIIALREGLLGLGQQEVERFRSRLGQLDEGQMQAVEELTRALVQKILHRPLRHLHGAVARGDVAHCAALYREIFGLPPDPGSKTPEQQETAEPPGPQRLIQGGKSD